MCFPCVLCPFLYVCAFFFSVFPMQKFSPKSPSELAWAVLPPGAGSVLLMDCWQLHLLLLPLLHPPQWDVPCPFPSRCAGNQGVLSSTSHGPSPEKAE